MSYNEEIAAIQKEIDNAMEQRRNLIREFERALYRDIARLEAKLSFIISSYDPHRDSFHQYQTKISTVQREIEYAIEQKGELNRLKQMRFVAHSLSQKFTNVNGYIIRYLEYTPTDASRAIPAAAARNKILVLIHGLGASAERWSHVIPALSRYYRVIVPDVIGFGYSDKPIAEYTMDFFIDGFFKPFLDSLGISKASIIGSSFGGHLATEFAIRFNDRVEKLVLVSPAGMMRILTPALKRYVTAALYAAQCQTNYQLVHDAFRDMVYNPSLIKEEMVRDFINRMGLTNARYAFLDTLREMGNAPDLRGRLSSITAQTLIVWGENDMVIPVGYASNYNEIPNCELHVIRDCGHKPYIENPAMFSSIVV